MPAPISTFVDVTVLVTGAAAQKFGFGRVMGVFNHSVTANRQDGPYFSLAEVNAAGFTSGAAPEVNAWATAVFAQDTGVDAIMIGREDAGDANWTATMDAIEAVATDTWYITNIESRADADIAEVTAWTEARTAQVGDPKIFIFQSADLAGLVPFTAANAAGYVRSGGIYHLTSTGSDGYLDGAWSSSRGGLNLDAPNGAGSWGFDQLEGVTFDTFTGAQANAMYAVNGNLYGRNKGLNFTSKGSMAATGRQIKTTTTIDWVTVRSQEAVLELLVGTPTEVALTNAGINQVSQVWQNVLDSGVSFGHFRGDDGFAPKVNPKDVSEISAADRQAGILALTGEAYFANSIQKVELTLNVQF